jgi:hypothetical protein
MDIMLVFETSGVGSIPARPAKTVDSKPARMYNYISSCEQIGKAPAVLIVQNGVGFRI